MVSHFIYIVAMQFNGASVFFKTRVFPPKLSKTNSPMIFIIIWRS